MEKKEVSQALLIADNFNDNFAPITNSINVVSYILDLFILFTYLASQLQKSFLFFFMYPKGLLPLVNVPLLDYALEALNRSGIEEVFVFCTTFKKKVKEHIV